MRALTASLAILLLSAAAGSARAQEENPTTPGAIPNPGSYQGSMELQRRENQQQQQYYQQQQRQPDYYPQQRSQPGYGRGVAPPSGGMAHGADVAAFKRGDYATAYRLTLPLAQRGDRNAQYNMGILYKKGLGVRRDDAQAAVWYRRAADQGDALASNDLAMAYAFGQGVPRDQVLSYVWFTRAAGFSTNAGDRAAVLKNRRELIAQMNPADLARAQALTAGAGPSRRR
jgi:TPR repeat protein